MAERNCNPVGTHAWTRGANRRGRAARVAAFALAGLCALAAAAAGGTAAVVSCDTSWVNATGGSWGVASNWSTGVPDQTKTACIRLAGTYVVTLSGSQSAAELTLGGSSGQQVLQIEGGTSPGADATLTLANQGANPDGIRARGVLRLTSGNHLSAAALVLAGSGTLRNSGMIASQRGVPGSRILGGALVNMPSGHVLIGLSTDAGSHDWVNQGSIAVSADATLDLHGGTLSSTGAVSGGGTIAAQLANAGQVTPGGGFGSLTLTVAGYTQATAGKLNERISNSGPSAQSTLLTASGAASLAGTLVVQTDPSFAPTLGQSFPVVSAASYTGEFAHVANALINESGLYFRPDYPGGQPNLVVTQATFTAPGSGVHGQGITLTGSGWRVLKPVRLSLTDSAGTTTVFKSPITDGTGSFSTTRFIPAGAATGTGTLTAKDTITGLTLTQPITIT